MSLRWASLDAETSDSPSNSLLLYLPTSAVAVRLEAEKLPTVESLIDLLTREAVDSSMWRVAAEFYVSAGKFSAAVKLLEAGGIDNALSMVCLRILEARREAQNPRVEQALIATATNVLPRFGEHSSYSSDAHLDMAKGLLSLTNGKPSEALQHLDSYSGSSPLYVQSLLLRVVAHRMLAQEAKYNKDIKECKKHAERALANCRRALSRCKIAPAQLFSEMGLLFSLLGDQLKAMACYQRSLDIDGTEATALTGLFLLYLTASLKTSGGEKYALLSCEMLKRLVQYHGGRPHIIVLISYFAECAGNFRIAESFVPGLKPEQLTAPRLTKPWVARLECAYGRLLLQKSRSSTSKTKVELWNQALKLFDSSCTNGEPGYLSPIFGSGQLSTTIAVHSSQQLLFSDYCRDSKPEPIPAQLHHRLAQVTTRIDGFWPAQLLRLFLLHKTGFSIDKPEVANVKSKLDFQPSMHVWLLVAAMHQKRSPALAISAYRRAFLFAGVSLDKCFDSEEDQQRVMGIPELSSPTLLHNIATCLHLLDIADGARIFYDLALERVPSLLESNSDVYHLRLENATDADAPRIADQWVHALSASTRYNKACFLAENGSVREAVDLLQLVIQTCPTYTMASLKYVELIHEHFATRDTLKWCSDYTFQLYSRAQSQSQKHLVSDFLICIMVKNGQYQEAREAIKFFERHDRSSTHHSYKALCSQYLDMVKATHISQIQEQVTKLSDAQKQRPGNFYVVLMLATLMTRHSLMMIKTIKKRMKLSTALTQQYHQVLKKCRDTLSQPETIFGKILNILPGRREIWLQIVFNEAMCAYHQDHFPNAINKLRQIAEKPGISLSQILTANRVRAASAFRLTLETTKNKVERLRMPLDLLRHECEIHPDDSSALWSLAAILFAFSRALVESTGVRPHRLDDGMPTVRAAHPNHIPPLKEAGNCASEVVDIMERLMSVPEEVLQVREKYRTRLLSKAKSFAMNLNTVYLPKVEEAVAKSQEGLRHAVVERELREKRKREELEAKQREEQRQREEKEARLREFLAEEERKKAEILEARARTAAERDQKKTKGKKKRKQQMVMDDEEDDADFTIGIDLNDDDFATGDGVDALLAGITTESHRFSDLLSDSDHEDQPEDGEATNEPPAKMARTRMPIEDDDADDLE